MDHFQSSVATHALLAARWGVSVQWGVYMVDWFGGEQLIQLYMYITGIASHHQTV